MHNWLAVSSIYGKSHDPCNMTPLQGYDEVACLYKYGIVGLTFKHNTNDWESLCYHQHTSRYSHIFRNTEQHVSFVRVEVSSVVLQPWLTDELSYKNLTFNRFFLDRSGCECMQAYIMLSWVIFGWWAIRYKKTLGTVWSMNITIQAAVECRSCQHWYQVSKNELLLTIVMFLMWYELTCHIHGVFGIY